MDIGLDISTTIHCIVRRAIASLPGSPRGSLLLREGERLVHRAAVGFDDPPPPVALPAMAALSELRVIPLAEWYQEPLSAGPAAAAGPPAGATVLAIPVRVHGEPCGYL